MSPTKRILLLLTGGTLVMRAAPDGGGALEPREFSDRLRQDLPELGRIADVEIRSLMAKDSSEMSPADWRVMAETIREHYDAFDGFVIVHGTDTMSYTASAISFLLPDLAKPIVLTGSQRPIGEIRSDGRINLVDAVTVASMPVPEVTVCLHSVLLRGNRSRKVSTVDYTAFESPNLRPLGQLGVNVELANHVLPPRGTPGAPLPRVLPMEERVGLLFLTPTTRQAEIERYASLGMRGLILLAFGAGNLPVQGSRLADAVGGLGIPTVVLSQCAVGPVDLTLYPGGRALLERGVIDGGDMTPEAALTKLMAGLGAGLTEATLREYLHAPIAGERRPLRPR